MGEVTGAHVAKPVRPSLPMSMSMSMCHACVRVSSFVAGCAATCGSLDNLITNTILVIAGHDGRRSRCFGRYTYQRRIDRRCGGRGHGSGHDRRRYDDSSALHVTKEGVHASRASWEVATSKKCTAPTGSVDCRASEPSAEVRSHARLFLLDVRFLPKV